MQCQSLGSHSPLARRLHVLVCPECRTAREADTTLRRGIERLNAELPPPDGLAHAMAAFQVPAAARPARSRRWKSRLSLRFLPVGSITLAAAAGSALWLRHIDAEPRPLTPPPPMPAVNAYNVLNAAIDAIPAADRLSPGSPMAQLAPSSHSFRHVDRVVVALEASQNIRANGEPKLEPPHDTKFAASGATLVTRSPAHPDGPNSGNYSHAAARRALSAEYRRALDIVRSSFALPYQPPYITSLYVTQPYLADYPRLARALTLEARVEAEDGSVGSAANSCLDAIELGALTPHGSTLSGKWTGFRCQHAGRASLWPLINKLTAPQARAAAARLGRIIRSQTPMTATIEADKRSCLGIVTEMFQNRNWRMEFNLGNNQVEMPQRLATYMALLPYSKQRILDDLTSVYDRAIANERRPYYARTDFDNHEPLASRDIVVAMLYPNFGYRFNEVAEPETQNLLLMTSLAIHAYKLEHGAPPVDLAKLVPDYLPSVPADPFGKGQALGYQFAKAHRAVLDGFCQAHSILYSVGPDCKDDSGQPIYALTDPVDNVTAAPTGRPDKVGKAVRPDSKGDIVAGFNTK